MKIGKLERKLNQWQFLIQYGKSWVNYNTRTIQIAILKLKNFPKEGNILSKKNYLGIYFCKSFRHPLTILRMFLESKGF